LVVIPAEAGIQKTVLDAVRSVEREPRISLVNIAEELPFTKRIRELALDKEGFSLIFPLNPSVRRSSHKGDAAASTVIPAEAGIQCVYLFSTFVFTGVTNGI
jgi:hypothetical protein